MPSPLQSSPVEARRCPVRSRAPRLRSGAAHCNLEPAVEVRRCPLRGGRGEEKEEEEKEEKEDKAEEKEDKAEEKEEEKDSIHKI